MHEARQPFFGKVQEIGLSLKGDNYHFKRTMEAVAQWGRDFIYKWVMLELDSTKAVFV